MNAILARIRRGYAIMWGWITRPFGRRAYRFEGERQNHAEQAAQTQTSIGLMAAAAQQGDDDHRIQAMQTELTLRARQDVLNRLRAERGLTGEERGEFESIDRALSNLGPQEPAQPAGAFQRLWDAPPPRPRLTRFLGAIPAMGSWQVWAAVGAFTAAGWGWGIWQTRALRIEQLEHRETTQIAAEQAAAAAGWRAQYEEAHADVIAAQQQAATTTQTLEAERRRARVSRRQAQERERAIQNVIVNDEPPPLDSLLQHHGADEGAEPDSGDPADRRAE